MRISNEQKVEDGISWKINFNNGHIVIVAHDLITGKRKLCEYDCNFNYRDGWQDQDIIEAYRIVDEFKEALTNGRD